MSGFNSDKCTTEELKAFKKTVLDYLQSQKINTDKLKIRTYKSYNGDVKIYTGDYMTLRNVKNSFRRIRTNKDENGNVIGYYGQRGIHETKVPNTIFFNRDEWKYFLSEDNKDGREYELDNIRKL